MRKYKRKYKYWHKVLDGHPDKLKQLGEDWQDLIIEHPYPKKPKGRIEYMNFETGEETWLELEYLGRVRAEANGEEVCETLGIK